MEIYNYMMFFHKISFIFDMYYNYYLFNSGASFQLFLGGAKIFLNFSMPPDY